MTSAHMKNPYYTLEDTKSEIDYPDGGENEMPKPEVSDEDIDDMDKIEDKDVMAKPDVTDEMAKPHNTEDDKDDMSKPDYESEGAESRINEYMKFRPKYVYTLTDDKLVGVNPDNPDEDKKEISVTGYELVTVDPFRNVIYYVYRRQLYESKIAEGSQPRLVANVGEVGDILLDPLRRRLIFTSLDDGSINEYSIIDQKVTKIIKDVNPKPSTLNILPGNQLSWVRGEGTERELVKYNPDYQSLKVIAAYPYLTGREEKTMLFETPNLTLIYFIRDSRLIKFNTKTRVSQELEEKRVRVLSHFVPGLNGFFYVTEDNSVYLHLLETEQNVLIGTIDPDVRSISEYSFDRRVLQQKLRPYTTRYVYLVEGNKVVRVNENNPSDRKVSTTGIHNGTF